MLAWKWSALPTFKRCRYFCSTMPFCWGVYRHECWKRVPLFLQKDCRDRNSLPLSAHKVLTGRLNWVWTQEKIDSITPCVSDLKFKRWIHVNRVKSSIIIRKYHPPVWVWIYVTPKCHNELNQKMHWMTLKSMEKKINEFVLLKDKYHKHDLDHR
jgi:hypothetical protein